MSYTKINWTNSVSTPLDADNLNHMDNGIYELDNKQIENEKSKSGLWNFTGNTIMLNSKNFENSDNYRTVESPTISVRNGCLEIATSTPGARAGIYGGLNKVVSLLSTGSNQLLVKLRVKASRATRIYPVKRYNYVNGTYIVTDNVVLSNLDSIGSASSYWQIDDTDWHDLFLIFNVAEEINEIGIMFEGYKNTVTFVYVQQFDVFLNTDMPESVALKTEFGELTQCVNNTESRLTKIENFGMCYITEVITLSQTTIYTVEADNIALSAPVSISITRGGENTVLVRADGVELIDTLTNKVVDSTMTDIEITADDLLAGLQLTEGGTLTVKYYNKNCEDLFNRINNLGSSYKTVTASYNTIETSNDFTVEEKEEIEV